MNETLREPAHGFTLVEVALALAIVGAATLTAAGLVWSGLRLAERAALVRQLTGLAHQRLQALAVEPLDGSLLRVPEGAELVEWEERWSLDEEVWVPAVTTPRRWTWEARIRVRPRSLGSLGSTLDGAEGGAIDLLAAPLLTEIEIRVRAPIVPARRWQSVPSLTLRVLRSQ